MKINQLTRFLLTAFLLGLLVFQFNGKIVRPIAQETKTEKQKGEPLEFYIDAVYIPCEDPTDEQCIPYPADAAGHPDPAKKDHELGLISQYILPAGMEVYIIGCINSADGPHCTTGSSELDDKLNSYPGGNQLSPSADHEFKALVNPVIVNKSGELGTVIVRSFTPYSTRHFFYGYFLEDVNTSTTTVSQPTIDPVEHSVSQGKIGDFETTTSTGSATDLGKKDTTRGTTGGKFSIDPSILDKINRNMASMGDVLGKHQDPKGRFFDSVSLEPIPNIEVALLDNTKKRFNHTNLVNPQTVKLNGEFNFWVPNGIYYLEIVNKPITYSWPVEMDKVHSGYSLGYFCDPEVKDEENKTVSLYNQQYSIIEYNKLVHCDVPLDPGNNTPYRSEVKTIDYSAYRIGSSNDVLYSGKVTHPLTVVSFMSDKKLTTIAAVKADRLGTWQLKLNNSQIPVNADGSVSALIIKYKKTDLTVPGKDQPYSSDQLIIEPILTYIEGYAYDESNQIIANARVGLRQSNSKKVSYLTYADSSGYFKIPSKYLPSFPYELVFVKPDSLGSVVTTTSIFTQKNSSYLKDKRLNLATDTRSGILSTSAGREGEGFNADGTSSLTKTGDQSKQMVENKSFRLILILLSLSILLSLIVVIVLYLRKKDG